MENKNCVSLPKEMVIEVGQYLSGKDHLSAALICKSCYTAFGYHIPDKDYLKTLVKVAREKKVLEFNHLIGQERPTYIREEIEGIRQYFQNLGVRWPLITILGINQTGNDSVFPLRPYDVSDQKKRFYDFTKIVAENISVANLLYHQGYAPKFFTKLALSYNDTFMHCAAHHLNQESLKIAFEIPSFKLNDRTSDGYTPVAEAFLSRADKKDEFAAIIKTFVQHPDFNPNEPCDPEDNTPLHIACMIPKKAAIYILLSHPDTDREIRNNAGKTALEEGRGVVRNVFELYDESNKKSNIK